MTGGCLSDHGGCPPLPGPARGKTFRPPRATPFVVAASLPPHAARFLEMNRTNQGREGKPCEAEFAKTLPPGARRHLLGGLACGALSLVLLAAGEAAAYPRTASQADAFYCLCHPGAGGNGACDDARGTAPPSVAPDATREQAWRARASRAADLAWASLLIVLAGALLPALATRWCACDGLVQARRGVLCPLLSPLSLSLPLSLHLSLSLSPSLPPSLPPSLSPSLSSSLSSPFPPPPSQCPGLYSRRVAAASLCAAVATAGLAACVIWTTVLGAQARGRGGGRRRERTGERERERQRGGGPPGPTALGPPPEPTKLYPTNRPPSRPPPPPSQALDWARCDGSPGDPLLPGSFACAGVFAAGTCAMSAGFAYLSLTNPEALRRQHGHDPEAPMTVGAPTFDVRGDVDLDPGAGGRGGDAEGDDGCGEGPSGRRGGSGFDGSSSPVGGTIPPLGAAYRLSPAPLAPHRAPGGGKPLDPLPELPGRLGRCPELPAPPPPRSLPSAGLRDDLGGSHPSRAPPLPAPPPPASSSGRPPPGGGPSRAASFVSVPGGNDGGGGYGGGGGGGGDPPGVGPGADWSSLPPPPRPPERARAGAAGAAHPARGGGWRGGGRSRRRPR